MLWGNMYLGRLLTILLIVSAMPGCSGELSNAIEAASKARGPANVNELPGLSSLINGQSAETSLDFEQPVSAVNTELPSPDRTNPFAISDEYETENREEGSHRKREVRVVGFIELDKPRVMLSIDGKSQMYASGETIDNITVNDIAPPTARITYDGISRSLSLFDLRSK